jgi:cell division protein FtsL
MEYIVAILTGFCIYLFVTLMNVKTDIENMRNNVSEQQMREAIWEEANRIITMHLYDCHRKNGKDEKE